MRWERQTRLWCYILIFFLPGLLLAGCGKPGDIANNLTNCVVAVTSVNGGEPFQSDVLTDGYASDDVITIQINSEFRAPDGDPTAPDGPSVFDTITFHSYHVTHYRSDGGPNPASFTAGMTLVVAPNSEGSIQLVVVRAFDKHRSPLQELRDDGEIFTTTIITVYGTDGNDNDVAASGAVTISYANFPDT